MKKRNIIFFVLGFLVSLLILNFFVLQNDKQDVAQIEEQKKIENNKKLEEELEKISEIITSDTSETTNIDEESNREEDKNVEEPEVTNIVDQETLEKELNENLKELKKENK